MKILTLMTSAKELPLTDGELYPSGFWSEEFAVPYVRFNERGYDIQVATVEGKNPFTDESSLEPDRLKWVRPAGTRIDDAIKAEEWGNTIANAPELSSPIAVEDIDKDYVASFDGLYMCGGHGCLADQPNSEAMGNIALWAYELNMPTAVVCHGLCAALSARDEAGNWPYKNYNMTCFSHDEEKVTPIYGRLPFVLEEEITRLGAKYTQANVIWDAYAVVDKNVVSGQNPYSSSLVAETFLNMLGKCR